jgi:hypothetical protein
MVLPHPTTTTAGTISEVFLPRDRKGRARKKMENTRSESTRKQGKDEKPQRRDHHPLGISTFDPRPI